MSLKFGSLSRPIMRSMMNSMEKTKKRTLVQIKTFWTGHLRMVSGFRKEEHNQFIERMAGLSRQQVANQNAWYSEE